MGNYFCSVLHPRQDLQHLTAVSQGSSHLYSCESFKDLK